MKDLIDAQVKSWIRTIVPTIVGNLLSWIPLGEILKNDGQITASLISGLTLLFTAIYYIFIRILEAKVSSKFGWLLGYPAEPKYKD